MGKQYTNISPYNHSQHTAPHYCTETTEIYTVVHYALNGPRYNILYFITDRTLWYIGIATRGGPGPPFQAGTSRRI